MKNEDQELFPQKLIDAIALPFIYQDINGKFLACNKPFEKLTGLSKEEIIGKTAFDLWEKPLAEEYRKKDLELLDNHVTQEYESFIESSYHTKHSVIFYRSAHINSRGKVIGLIGLIVDIMDYNPINEELNRANEEWSRTFNAISDSIFIIDDNHVILKANQAFLKLMNRKEEEVLGRKCFEIMHKLSKPFPGCPFEKTRVDLNAHTVEVDDPNIGIPLLVTTSPILDEKGKLIGSVHISKDISEQKKAEESRARMAAIVESSDDAIIGKALDGTITSWNRGAERTYGYTQEEVRGKNISIIVPPSRMTEISEFNEKVGNGGHIDHFDTLRLRKDGTIIEVSLTISPIHDKSGNITGISTVAHNITERKQIEKKLSAEEKKYRELVENANSIILKLDKEGRMTFINEFAQKFFGFSQEEALGKKVMETIVPGTDSSGENLGTMIRNLCSSPGEYISNENENVLKNGTRVWVSWTNKAICNEQGKVIEILCVGNDITARKKAEEELKKKIHDLERFQKITVGRELKMKELKNKISELEEKIAKGAQNRA